MEWSKVKNIIILMLVCMNVFLLILVGLREGRAARYQEGAREDAVAALERGGITFALEKVPRDMTLTPMTVTRSRDNEQAMA